jgi:hypothetical protein
MVTKVFQSLRKWNMPHVFKKHLMRARNIWQPPFCGNWKKFFAIWKIVTIGWWPNFLDCHTLSNFGPPLMATEKF